MEEITNKKFFKNYGFFVLILLVVFAIVFALIRRLSKPMDGYVEDLSEKATIDILSGVLNRRAYEEQISRLLAEGISHNYVFIMLDVDFFKSINDTLGHDYGDDVIRRLGHLLSKHFLESQTIKPIIGRLGGDEFTVFISYENAEDKDKILDLINKLLEAFLLEFDKEREQIPVSLSCGVAFDDNKLTSYQELYMAADSALYEAKENGKNQFTFYNALDDSEK